MRQNGNRRAFARRNSTVFRKVGDPMATKRTSLTHPDGVPPGATPAPKKTQSKKKGNSLANAKDNESANRVQVAFRMNKDAYRDLKRMALDEDTTVNDLILRAINELRESKGLKKLSS
jgi:NRPS condensation-like uncharacterized protein